MVQTFLIAAIFGLISFSQGCHHGKTNDDNNVVQKITKRHTPLDMEEFLAGCITEKTARFSSALYVPTIVDFMIRHSSWFEETDTIYCPSDDNACWKRLVNYFMRWNSPYLKPAKACIDEFTIAGGGKVTSSYQTYHPSFLPQSSATGDINIHDFKNLFRLNAPNGETSDATTFDLQSLVSYFRTEYICTPSFCDCSGLALAPGEGCGDTWISRIVGATKPTSVFKSALITAANVAIQQRNQRRQIEQNGKQREREEQERRQQGQKRNSYNNLLNFYFATVLSDHFPKGNTSVNTHPQG